MPTGLLLLCGGVAKTSLTAYCVRRLNNDVEIDVARRTGRPSIACAMRRHHIETSSRIEQRRLCSENG